MDQDERDLEEGEIEDDDVNVYTPLPRPETYALDAPSKRFPEVDTKYSESEGELQSSDSDSDSDAGLQQSKKPKKVKITPRPLHRKPETIKKYDIWSTRAQEDVLAETMISCDVTLKDRSRNVESYDASMAKMFYQQGNKRTRADMKNNHFKPKERVNNPDEEFKGKPREIIKLDIDESSSVKDVVKEIALKLSEERDDLISKVVEEMGKEKAIEIFEETRRIEREGGMPILNQTRRRTPGGVFLYLVRNDYHITPEQKKNIFSEEKHKYNKIVRERRKNKLNELKVNMNIERNKLLPELLTRAEVFKKEKSQSETDEANCTNPPPSPESDNHESGECPDPPSVMELQSEGPVAFVENPSTGLNSIRGNLKTYDDDFLDINCENEMDFF